MSSRANWLSWIGGGEREGAPIDEVDRMRQLLQEKEAQIAALSRRVEDLADTASRETARANEFAERSNELAQLLGEAESACAKLEESLCRADLRSAENEVRMCTEAGRADVASKLASSADERYRDVVQRWRDAEKLLVRTQHERTLAKQHQTELQMALSKAAQDRQLLQTTNQKLQAQLKVALFDKEDAAAVSGQRLIQVEQRVRFAFDELECLGDDAHHLLRLVCDGMWARAGEDMFAAMRDAKSNVVREWVERRFAGCATTQDVLATASDLLVRLRLARLEVIEHVPLEVRVVPLGEGRSGADAIVGFTLGLLTQAALVMLRVKLSATVNGPDGQGYRVSLSVECRSSVPTGTS
jgi:hypothetical protein